MPGAPAGSILPPYRFWFGAGRRVWALAGACPPQGLTLLPRSAPVFENSSRIVIVMEYASRHRLTPEKAAVGAKSLYLPGPLPKHPNPAGTLRSESEMERKLRFLPPIEMRPWGRKESDMTQ